MSVDLEQKRKPSPAARSTRFGVSLREDGWVRWASALFAVFVFGATLLSGTNAGYDPDMRLYISKALELGGESHDQALQDAAKAWCTGAVLGDNKAQSIDQWSRGNKKEEIKPCAQDAYGVDTGWNPRYLAIFEARIGVSLLYTPFVTVLGAYWGMWAGAGFIAACCGLLVGAMVRILGGGRHAALAGQMLFAALPLGWLAERPMAEGPQYLSVLATLCGAGLLARGRLRSGLLVIIPAFALTMAVKDSTALILDAVLAAGASALLLSPRTRTRGMATLAAGSATAVGATVLWSHLRHNPGLTATVQDLLTADFGSPDVKDPWNQLLQWEGRFWPWYLVHQLYAPMGLIAIMIAVWALWRRSRAALLLGASPAVVAAVSVAAHPAQSEASRIASTGWLTMVVGLAVALDSLIRRKIEAEYSTPDA